MCVCIYIRIYNDDDGNDDAGNGAGESVVTRKVICSGFVLLENTAICLCFEDRGTVKNEF